MGVLASDNRPAQDEGPQCPSSLFSTFNKYKDLKFAKRITDSEIKLYARDTLNWADLVAYSRMMKSDITIHEAGLIMDLDSIFEGRDDG